MQTELSGNWKWPFGHSLQDGTGHGTETWQHLSLEGSTGRRWTLEGTWNPMKNSMESQAVRRRRRRRGGQ